MFIILVYVFFGHRTATVGNRLGENVAIGIPFVHNGRQHAAVCIVDYGLHNLTVLPGIHLIADDVAVLVPIQTVGEVLGIGEECGHPIGLHNRLIAVHVCKLHRVLIFHGGLLLIHLGVHLQFNGNSSKIPLRISGAFHRKIKRLQHFSGQTELGVILLYTQHLGGKEHEIVTFRTNRYGIFVIIQLRIHLKEAFHSRLQIFDDT